MWYRSLKEFRKDRYQRTNKQTAVTKLFLGEEKESQSYYFVYGILSGSQSNYDIEIVAEIFTAKEKYLSLS